MIFTINLFCAKFLQKREGYHMSKSPHQYRFVFCFRVISFTFPFSRQPWKWNFMTTSADVSWKVEDAYPTSASGPCSRVLVYYRLLISSCFAVRALLLFHVNCFACLYSMFIFHPWNIFVLIPLESTLPWSFFLFLVMQISV